LRQATETLAVATRRGLTEITDDVRRIVQASGVRQGLCTVYIRHTSASLVIQENADPAVQRDLEEFLSRLVPEDEALYTHRAEGPDDMPSHVKAVLTRTSEQVPVRDGEPVLGTWQGIYVWEHRQRAHRREVVVHVIGS
jgi:secondary thiamine-phosphate synthase enzyme